ncbi:protein Sis1p [Trichomonascus vanleenenianus]|uniref:type II HSP40 co-chaperone SIS1 n=1 Tax=Trichomonascus vanleenenianus TaxID=2268995 RepID=UPI003ECB85A6
MVKEKGLYDLLGVSTDADENQIKKGYRKAALKYHPDKPTGDTEKFKQISEAFDILSNPEKRQLYDNFGLEAARRGGVMPEANGPQDGAAGAQFAGGNPFAAFGGGGGGGPGGGARTFRFSTGPGGGGGFGTADAFNIFSQFAESGGFEGEDDIFSMLGGGTRRRGAPGASPFGGMGGMGGGMPGGMPGGMGAAPSPQQLPKSQVQIKLPVSLEDLAVGTTKKMKIKRRREHGIDEKILHVQIKPGWKAGTKITFANEGDLQPNGTLQDVVFVIDEKPNETFTRNGDDLEQTLTLSLKEALTGFSRIVQTIDGKKLKVQHVRPTSPGHIIRYPNYGMPISKKPGHRGDMAIKIAVKFPDSLTPAQKEAIEKNFD